MSREFFALLHVIESSSREALGLALRVSLKPSDNKAIYGFSFSHPVAEADVAEASKSAQDGLGSRSFAGVAVDRSAESGEDDVGGGDA
jgi:hypothetical protein